MQTSLIGKFCHAKMHVRSYVNEPPDVDVNGYIAAVNDRFFAVVEMAGRLYEVDLLAETTQVSR